MNKRQSSKHRPPSPETSGKASSQEEIGRETHRGCRGALPIASPSTNSFHRLVAKLRDAVRETGDWPMEWLRYPLAAA